MNRDRIVLYDNSPAKAGEGWSFFENILTILVILGALSMLSYWLMEEVFKVWRHPFDHIGYTLFITAAFVFLHAAILAGFIWLVRAVAGLLIMTVKAVCLPFIFIWRVGSVVYDKAWIIAHAIRNFISDNYSRIKTR